LNAKAVLSQKSSLPKNDEALRQLLAIQGPTIIVGKEWFVDEQGQLRFRTIPELKGSQLSPDVTQPPGPLSGGT